jgi:small subunit ribosomal protein S8
MSMSDPLADMITRIRNGQRANKKAVNSPASKLRQRVLDVLEREGYIRGYVRSEEETGKPDLSIELKYYEGDPVIREIKRISKPGRRVYSSVNDLPRVRNGLGISIVSTPKGVLSDAEARVICLVLVKKLYKSQVG